MAIAEARLPNGIFVALNNSPASVAFVFQGKRAFIDIRDGVLAIWDNKCLTIHGKDFAYNRWHPVEEDSALYRYMKDLIASDYQNPLEGVQWFSM